MREVRNVFNRRRRSTSSSTSSNSRRYALALATTPAPLLGRRTTRVRLFVLLLFKLHLLFNLLIMHRRQQDTRDRILVLHLLERTQARLSTDRRHRPAATLLIGEETRRARASDRPETRTTRVRHGCEAEPWHICEVDREARRSTVAVAPQGRRRREEVRQVSNPLPKLFRTDARRVVRVVREEAEHFRGEELGDGLCHAGEARGEEGGGLLLK